MPDLLSWAMRLLKSVGAGALALVAGFIASMAVWASVGYAYMWTQMADGSGGIGAYSSGIQIPVLSGLVFGIVGFIWQWRRGRVATASA